MVLKGGVTAFFILMDASKVKSTLFFILCVYLSKYLFTCLYRSGHLGNCIPI